MIKFAFKLYSAISILSPWIFLLLRGAGVYDFKYDVGVFFGLFLLSGIVMFLTFKRW